MAQAIDASKDRPSDPRNQEVVFPAGRDPQNSNLETPVNSSGLVKWFINNLPAYRPGITDMRRGLEVGMAHGYWVLGPFTKLGPLRDTDVANIAGLISTLGMVAIMTATMALYSASNPPQPVATVTTGGQVPATFKSPESWNNYISGFLIGGIGGAVFAYFVLTNIAIIKNVFGGLLS